MMSKVLPSSSVHVPAAICGVGVTTQTRYMSTISHNDMEVPDFSYYRRSDTKSSTSKPRDSAAKRQNFSYLMAGATGITMAYSATTVVNHLVSTLSASKDVLAMAQIEVNLADIPEGKNMTFKWRGKPLFIRHR
jgi:ubiquinol-cytochrome c reductase iron-sulfur subunit